MAHIKKVVIQGFKSFAKKTEVLFDKGINVIIGPNGSGKSNISDAICFALGRLSVKSMRAEKTSNLIFMGSKYIKPAHEAYVELVFENSDRAFSMDRDEITLKRAVRRNGQSVYKINDETKTRAEIIETLAQAGIDPYGFNLILQGQIQSIVKMHGEERRKIIGEVAGISVYEWRKEKSLKELEKTEERLKEISTILRERTAFMNNLEREKQQAQRFKDLQLTVKRAKASILSKKLEEKKKEVEAIMKAIGNEMDQKEKKSEKVEKKRISSEDLLQKINEINKHIRDSSGVEQTKLREQLTNLKAELEGLKVRKEGYENRKDEIGRRISEMQKTIPEMESEIKKLRQESPIIAQKAKELRKKKEELAEIEKERKSLHALRAEFVALKDRIEDRRRILARATAESESLVKQMEESSRNLKNKNEKETSDEIENIKIKIEKTKNEILAISTQELENEKTVSVSEAEISRSEEIKKKVEKIDVCPLCQCKITEEHVNHVYAECDEKIGKSREEIENCKKTLAKLHERSHTLHEQLRTSNLNMVSLERELLAHNSINEKREILKKTVEYEKSLKHEVVELENRRKSLENKVENIGSIEERYSNKMLEIEEISSRTSEDVDTSLLFKERELEKTLNVIERSKQDRQNIEEQIEEISLEIDSKESSLEKREKQEEELNKKFRKMFADRDRLQKDLSELNFEIAETEREIRHFEDQVNVLKIGKAKLEGEKDTIEMDFSEYKEFELLQGSLIFLEEKLKKTNSDLETIGSINLRALEVYDKVKTDYEEVRTKADTIEKEKSEIMKIIDEIDKKKKKTFMKAFNGINELFSRNFSKLYSKGTAYLEAENKEDLFSGGVDIVVKLAKGKYFDVSSLSGGEQTMVALSLLFAIQEYKPYQFYILDEIDAALDKRNSERLANLLEQHTKSGQYIVVTHNDAIILDSDILYGVSMHEGVSKILSVRLGEKTQTQIPQQEEITQITPGQEIRDMMDEELKKLEQKDNFD